MTFRRRAFVAAEIFIGTLLWRAIGSPTESAATFALWGSLVFLGLFLVPTERFSTDDALNFMKIWKGKSDDNASP